MYGGIVPGVEPGTGYFRLEARSARGTAPPTFCAPSLAA